jgi:hypothetical protein
MRPCQRPCLHSARVLAIFALLGASALATAGAAHSPREACPQDSPVLTSAWNALALGMSPDYIGEWQLPLSAQKPAVLTEARVRVDLLQAQDTREWNAQVSVTFPDPKPFGLPYTLERLVLQWTGPAGPQTAGIDWSKNCTQPGRSLFPGQSWTDSFALPGSETAWTIDAVSLRVWGSRN